MTLLATAASSRAQEATSDNATVLQKIVVKGKRVKAGSVADTPLATETTAQQIEDKQITSIQDLGRTTEPGISFSKAAGTVNIRGLTGPRVTTLIDGIPIPYLDNKARNAGGGSPLTNADGAGDSFDFNTLSTLDVMRGSDSSRAGNGALGGALVLRTLEPEDLIGAGKDWGGLVKETYDSSDNSFASSVAVAKKIQNTSILFQGTYKKGDERKNNGSVDAIGATRTEANPGDLDQHNVLAKVRQEFDGGHKLGLTAERFKKTIETDLKSFQGATTGSNRVYAVGDYNQKDEIQRDRLSVDYSFIAPSSDSWIDQADLTIYTQRIVSNGILDGTRLGAVAGPWHRDNELDERSVGLTGVLSKTLETDTLIHNLTLGGDLAFAKATQYTAGIDGCILGTATPAGQAGSCPNLHTNQSDMPNVDAFRGGIYLDDRIEFRDTGFALTPGIRMDWYNYDTKDSAGYRKNTGYTINGLPDGQGDIAFSPKLLATYDLTPGTQLYAQWARSFRAPTYSELFLNYRSAFYQVTGNPDLKPETGNGFEIGTKFDHDNWNGRVAIFHNVYSNFIDQSIETIPGFQNRSYKNLDKARISGLEVSINRQFDNGINLHGGLAYAYGKNVDANTPLRTVAPLKFVAGIGYQREIWGTDLTFVAASKMRDDHDATTFDAPGYGLFDLTAWWEPEQTTGLKIQAGIYNILDKTYYDALEVASVNTAAPTTANSNQPRDFYSEPGRSFKISLTQKF
jgi:hemoglobin/transferrin/lactoferrin receptor protein